MMACMYVPYMIAGWISSVAFSADGRHMASASGQDCSVQVWERPGGKWGNESAIHKAAFKWHYITGATSATLLFINVDA